MLCVSFHNNCGESSIQNDRKIARERARDKINRMDRAQAHSRVILAVRCHRSIVWVQSSFLLHLFTFCFFFSFWFDHFYFIFFLFEWSDSSSFGNVFCPFIEIDWIFASFEYSEVYSLIENAHTHTHQFQLKSKLLVSSVMIKMRVCWVYEKCCRRRQTLLCMQNIVMFLVNSTHKYIHWRLRTAR